MPGPIFKPSSFPGLKTVPESLRKAVEFFFPQTPDIGSAVPLTSIGKPIAALTPEIWEKSLAFGKQHAPAVMEEIAHSAKGPLADFNKWSVRDWRLGKGSPHGQIGYQMNAIMDDVEKQAADTTQDALQAFVRDRRQFRVPTQSPIQAPEGFTFALPRTARTTRDPMLEALAERQQRFYERQGRSVKAEYNKLATPSRTSGEDPLTAALTARNLGKSLPSGQVPRPPLSGRWNRHKNHQINTLKANQRKTAEGAKAKNPAGFKFKNDK